MLKEKSFNKNFENFYKKYAEKIKIFIYKKLKNWDLANDLTQETFIKIYARKNSLNIKELPNLPYLYKTALHIVIDYYRKNEKSGKKTIKYIDEINLIDAFKNNPEEEYIKGEVLNSLYDTVKSFSEKDQEIFYLKNFNKKKLIEISQEKNLCYYQVRKKIRKINNRIKENLEKYFKS